MINFHNKRFKTIVNTLESDSSPDTIFHYTQEGELVSVRYKGGSILLGTLIGFVTGRGELDMWYQHIITGNEIRIGKCRVTPKLLPGGRLKLLEEWVSLDCKHSMGIVIKEEI